MGVHRETLYRGLRKLRTDAEEARRAQGSAGGLQRALEQQVRSTGLPGTSSFEGKVASRWAPRRLKDFSAPRSDSFEQVLAVIAVWESWKGRQTLASDGRVRPAWLSGEACKDWRRLLEEAHQETVDARRRSSDASSVEAEVDAAVARYRKRLVEVYGHLNLDVLGPEERAGEQPLIGLHQVFEAPLVAWDPPRPELPARMWRELVERGEMSEDDLPPGLRAEQIDKWRRRRTERPPQPVLQAVASQDGRRLVVLGDPGAGKSTLAKYLALTLAGGCDETMPGELAELATAVPVVLELRHLAVERWQGRTVEDFWEELNATERMCLPRHVLEHLLNQPHRPVLVVFDGLDEIFAPARRAEVARQIAAFAQAHSHHRILVTSRVYGFSPGAFTAAGFRQVKLEDLTRKQVESFIRRWYQAAHPTSPAEASRLTDRLLSAVRGFPSVAELAGNPLLLTILASIGLGATIPRDRREVYRRAVDVLTGRWDRDAKHLQLPRQSHPDVAAAIDELDAGLLQELLERLARQLQEGAANTRTGTLISGADLTGLISSFVTEMNYPQPVARRVAQIMVERLHERAFLIHPYGAGMYGFVHRTFLEYLAARDLSQRYTAREWTPDQLIDMLAQRAADPAWHEVILLLLGQISRQAEEEHAAFIARLLKMHRRPPSGAVRQFQHESLFLTLAIRALAEAHRIGRTPPRRPEHPDTSLAVQSNAVIDALTRQMTNTPWLSVDGALPAIASLPWSWSGRDRFHQWYRARLAQPTTTRWTTMGRAAAAMCRNPREASRLAQATWTTPTAGLLSELAQRWPDHEDSHPTVLTAARDTTASEDVRATALRTLGEQWPDHEDSHPTVLTAARDTTTPENVRATALRTLGEQWPDHEDSRKAVLTAARDTTASEDVRATALRTLGERWPDHEDSHPTVLTAARDTTTPENVRATALQMLSEQWPDHEDSHPTVLTAARDTTTPDRIRATALQTLSEQWPDHEDSHPTVLTAARDTTTPENVRFFALYALSEQWPDHEDSHPTVLTAARDTTTPKDVRDIALQMLSEQWPDHEDSRKAVLTAARDTTTSEDVRDIALQMLSEQWPDHEDSRKAVLTAARDTTTSEDVRVTALRTLSEQWPDHEDSRKAVLTAARDTTAPENVRVTALRTLSEQWPDHEDSRKAVLTAARDTTTPDRIRVTALRTLGEQWPDHEDSHPTVLTAARDTTTPENVRAAVLEVLVERWPDQRDAWYLAASMAESATREETRQSAVLLLALVWPEAKETAAMLVKALKEGESEDVCAWAERALLFVKRTAELNAAAEAQQRHEL